VNRSRYAAGRATVLRQASIAGAMGGSCGDAPFTVDTENSTIFTEALITTSRQ
jgi:hypothetical protein